MGGDRVKITYRARSLGQDRSLARDRSLGGPKAGAWEGNKGKSVGVESGRSMGGDNSPGAWEGPGGT